MKLFIWTYVGEWQRFTSCPRRIFRPTDDFGGLYNHQHSQQNQEVLTENFFFQFPPKTPTSGHRSIMKTAKIIRWPGDECWIRHEVSRLTNVSLDE